MQSNSFPNIGQVLTDLQGSNNESRVKAESDLKELRKSYGRELFTQLSMFIHLPAGSEIATQKLLACILLKKFFLDERPEEKELEQITLGDVSQLKQLLETNLDIANEPMNLLRRKAEILCKLHKKEGSYAELVQQLSQLAGKPASNDETTIKGKEFAMYVFELLSEYHLPQEQIVNNSKNFMQLFTQTLNDTSVRVRVATLKALTCFLTSIDEEDEVMKYRGMMELLLDVVIQVLLTAEEEGKASLESLIELTQSYAEIWSQSIGKLIYVCSEIMKNKNFDIAPRQSALEIITTLTESSPKLLRDQITHLKSDLFPALCIMITQPELEDDLQEWADQPDQQVREKQDPASVATDALERLASQLGEKTTIQCSSQIIYESVNNQNSWQFRQAGFTFLGMIAETCVKTFKKEMTPTIQMVARGLLDEHPRVRHAALMALGLLLNVLSPHIQMKFHAEMMPQLIKMMQEEQFIKMRSQVASCTVNFVRGLIENSDGELVAEAEFERNKQILFVYVDRLIPNIQQLLDLALSTNHSTLQDESLGLLSCLAEALGEQFAPHYSNFMPALKKILQITPYETQTQQDLRAQCISTIGTILDSVKDQPEVCRQDALEISTGLIQLLGQIKEADPQLLAIQNILAQLAGSLKESFTPFLPTLMNSLHKDMVRGLDFKIVDAVEEELEEDEEDNKHVQKISLKIKGVEGNKTIQMNTVALENKLSAIQTVGAIAQKLGLIFFPYVEVVSLAIVNELIHDKISSSVRKAATKLCSVLLDCCPDNLTQTRLLLLLLPQISGEINMKLEKLDFRSVKWLTKELQRCVKVMTNAKEPFLQAQETAHLLDLCVKVLNTFDVEKKSKMDMFEQQKKKMDEEDIEAYEEQMENDDKVWDYVMDLAGTLLKTMSTQCSTQVRDKLLPLYGQKLLSVQKSKTHELLASLCLLVDCLEFGTEELFSFIVSQATPKMLEVIRCLGQTQHDLTQTCIFGLGVIAQRSSVGQFAEIQQIIKTTEMIMNNQKFFIDENEEVHTCVDNAVSTYGKLIYFHNQSGLITEQKVSDFMQRLPLITDCDEAQVVHLQFIKQVMGGNPILSNPQGKALETLKRIANVANSNAALEILNDEGKTLYSQFQ